MPRAPITPTFAAHPVQRVKTFNGRVQDAFSKGQGQSMKHLIPTNDDLQPYA